MTVRREGQKLWESYKVRGYHIDVNGHVNNAEYLHFIEDARDDFMAYLGVSIAGLAEKGTLVFISEVRLKYRQPALYGDVLDIWGWVCELRRVKSAWKLEIYRQGAGEMLTEAWVHIAFLDAGKRIIPIPDKVRSLFSSVYLAS